jgi:hypothetical protein
MRGSRKLAKLPGSNNRSVGQAGATWGGTKARQLSCGGRFTMAVNIELVGTDKTLHQFERIKGNERDFDAQASQVILG